MPAYLIADIDVHDPDRFKEYVTRVPPFVEKHGGTYLVRGGEMTIEEGVWPDHRLVIIAFPSRTQAEAFLRDEDYQPIAAIRHEATTSNLVIVAGHSYGGSPEE